MFPRSVSPTPMPRTLTSVTAMVVVTMSTTAAAQSHNKKSFDDNAGAIVWGTTTFHLSLVGSIAVNNTDSLAYLVGTSALTLGLTVGASVGAAKGKWRTDIPASATAFVNAGYGGWAVGCAIVRPLITTGSNDLTTAGACTDKTLPWVFAGIAGAASASYIMWRRDKLFRDPANADAAAWATAGPTLSFAATTLGLVSAMGIRALVGTAINGKKVSHPDNSLFPNKRGAMLTFGMTQLALIAGSLMIAELKL